MYLYPVALRAIPATVPGAGKSSKPATSPQSQQANKPTKPQANKPTKNQSKSDEKSTKNLPKSVQNGCLGASWGVLGPSWGPSWSQELPRPLRRPKKHFVWPPLGFQDGAMLEGFGAMLGSFLHLKNDQKNHWFFNRFLLDFQAILASKSVPKSIKNRSQID